MVEIYGADYFAKTWAAWVDGIIKIEKETNGKNGESKAGSPACLELLVCQSWRFQNSSMPMARITIPETSHLKDVRWERDQSFCVKRQAIDEMTYFGSTSSVKGHHAEVAAILWGTVPIIFPMKDVLALEEIQRTFTRMILEMKGWSYEERFNNS
eukprot:g39954.t1